MRPKLGRARPFGGVGMTPPGIFPLQKEPIEYRVTVAGNALGLLLSLAATRLMTSLLFDVSATDPLTLIAISVLLSGVAALAAWVPARRATTVDPMIALRCE